MNDVELARSFVVVMFLFFMHLFPKVELRDYLYVGGVAAVFWTASLDVFLIWFTTFVVGGAVLRFLRGL